MHTRKELGLRGETRETTLEPESSLGKRHLNLGAHVTVDDLAGMFQA